MKSFVLLSALVSITATAHSSSYGQSYQYSYRGPYTQHGATIPQEAASGDLLGMHSFSSLGSGLSYGGLGSLGGYGGHNILLSAGHFGSHRFTPGSHGHRSLQLVDYGFPERSKLYGGYVGGFGGYAKGALDSIQHLNQGGVRLPLLSYGAPKTSSIAFGSHAGLRGHDASLGLHAPIAHYERHQIRHGHQNGHLGFGIGGTQYEVEYTKAASAA